MPRLRVAALPAPTDFRDGCGSGDVSWRGLLRSATTAIERQRRIAAGKVARRLPPVTDRKKFSDDSSRAPAAERASHVMHWTRRSKFAGMSALIASARRLTIGRKS
jgi:hypothetical protein